MSLVAQKANWILIVNDGFALHLVRWLVIEEIVKVINSLNISSNSTH